MLSCACSCPSRPWLQRGDAEVSQKLWRVVRACVELGEANPIEQIHDQVGRQGRLDDVHGC